ncbi:putative negative regulator of RcsB-dependent stress response [Wenyingzhuangia heitensis]|uniref:Negative regulator of RcsB-dependent stress response n=1 Tax=Wenyingzhuangia heitensis TaxID=1487859 RepID=A0ABX0U8E9_9FLAO|nr:tetratricopeptide repeat protein [Wenyingzhuangia heitensis]NIJ45102.1 putative negative regulator of RcsB-dependent stress response [Wenyingzhuangia heitensis]
MATYQKRGYKKTIENEEEVIVDNSGNTEHSTTAEVFNTLDETANKSEKWIEKNSKPLFIGLIAAVVIIFGYMGYTQFIEIPAQKKAANALVFAKQEFTKATNSNDTEAYKTALEGAQGNFGLVDIAKQYGSTEAGNLAKYYAGISYLNLKEYNNAIEYLTSVTSNDVVLNTVIKGSIGDAYLADNNSEEALNYYSKAAAASDNIAVAPVYLLKAGKLALSLQDYSKAEELFTNIKEDYPTSSQAGNIDLYINQAKYAN